MVQAVLFFVFALAIGTGLGEGCSGGDKDPIGEKNDVEDTSTPIDEAPELNPPETANFSLEQTGEDLLFTWREVERATQYELYLANEPLSSLGSLESYSGLTGGTKTSGLESNSYILPAPEVGMVYYAVYIALDDEGERLFQSAEISGFRVTTPSNLVVISKGNTLEISWDLAEGVAAYNLYLADESMASGVTREEMLSYQNAQVIKVSTGNTYRFENPGWGRQVFARVSSDFAYGTGETEASEEARGVLANTSELLVDWSQGDIEFSWGPVSYTDFYTLYIAQESFDSLTNLSEVNTLVGGRMITDLTETTYRLIEPEAGEYFAVFTASTSGGIGPVSNQVSIINPGVPNGAWPMYVGGAASIEWHWGALPFAQTYNLYLSSESFVDDGVMTLASGLADRVVVREIDALNYVLNTPEKGRSYFAVLSANWVYQGKEYESLLSPETMVFTRDAMAINDSGMNVCSNINANTQGNSFVSCVETGSSADIDGIDGNGNTVPAGQDGHYGRDAMAASGQLTKYGSGDAGFDYLKLNSDGTEYRGSGNFNDEPWRCVHDLVTGLVWEVKTDDDGVNDTDSLYTWYNSDSATNGGNSGAEDSAGNTCVGYDSSDNKTFCNTQAYVNQMNAMGLCGINNWRLPRRSELKGLVHYGPQSEVAIRQFFPTIKLSDRYWSSTPFAEENSERAWVMIYNGSDQTALHNTPSYVRLVSDGGKGFVQP